MKLQHRKNTYLACFALFGAVLLTGCASSHKADPAPGSDAGFDAKMSQSKAVSSSEPAAPVSTATPVVETKIQTAPSTPAPAVSENTAAEPALAEPIRVVKSCKKEPFVKYEQTAREGINKAWQDTEAGRFGYGFTDASEYKKWKEAHNELFSAVAVSCQVLTTCADKAGRGAKKACAQEARTFAGWQRTSKEFLAKVESMESGMAPQLCSVSPNAGDLSDCYDRLADRIDNSCTDENCQEISRCWRSVAYLDQAIRQAESSCGFAGEKLTNCRGYTEATGRRKAKFEQCQSQYNSAKIEHFPVL